MQPCLSVRALNEQIKSLLEATFLHVRVEGEVSRPTYHGSGHLYFTLKDADATVSCVMFKGNNQRLKFRIEEGMQLVVWGSVSVYAPRGSYQVNCVGAEPSGSGALALAYEQLKKAFEAKGYFDPVHKKPLPLFPSHVALVTSATGAALQDMLQVATRRWPLVKITLCEALVQGEGAAQSIARALGHAAASGAEAIVLGRGGGSVEDLWAFNEPVVAEAVFTCNVPIVSAVGHEIDTVLTDFIADKRAPTPSAAMELLLPDRDEMRLHLDHLATALAQRATYHLRRKEEGLRLVHEGLKRHSLDAKLALMHQEIQTTQERFANHMVRKVQTLGFSLEQTKEALRTTLERFMAEKAAALRALALAYAAASPSKEARVGWAQVVQEGRPVWVDALEMETLFELQTPTCKVEAKALRKLNMP